MDEMARHPIDERTADRLTSGGMAPDDAPPGYEHVARLVRAAQAPASAAELAGEKQIASLAAAAIAGAGQATPSGRHRKSSKVISKLGTVRAAAITAAAVLGAGAAAAAATGSLPSQTHGSSSPTTVLTVSNTGSGVSEAGATQSNPKLKNSNPLGLPTTGAANVQAVIGLCRAFLARGSTTSPTSTAGGATASPGDNSTAVKALRKDATGSEEGSLTATASWCTTYLAKYSPGQSGTNPNGNPVPQNGNAPSGKPSSSGNPGSHSSSGSGSVPGNSSSIGAGQPGKH